MGVQNLASVHVEPAAVFLFFKEGGSEALSKTEIHKINKTENFGAPDGLPVQVMKIVSRRLRTNKYPTKKKNNMASSCLLLGVDFLN